MRYGINFHFHGHCISRHYGRNVQILITVFLCCLVLYCLEIYSTNYGDLVGDQRDDCVLLSETPYGASLREELMLSDTLFDGIPFKILPTNEKFIHASTCAGFGNQIFQYAAVYGLGRRVGRQPLFSIREKCQRELNTEVATVFDKFYQQIHFFNETMETTAKLYEFQECCGYDVPNDLADRPETVIRVHGALQNYHWFHDYRDDIRQVLECSLPTVKQIQCYNNELIGAKQMANVYHRRICVHTRRGDFVAENFATSLDYTVAAIDRILHMERNKYLTSSFSVLLLGIDKFFLQSVQNAKVKEASKDYNVSYHIPRNMARTTDLCYGITTCHTILITAPLSTFSWWMAYLSNATVYYNANIGPTAFTSANILPEWIPLAVPT